MPCYNFRPVDNTYTTPMAATIPRLEELLPQLLEFVRTLARQIEAGEIQDGDALGARIRDFYTAEVVPDSNAVLEAWLRATATEFDELNHSYFQNCRPISM